MSTPGTARSRRSTRRRLDIGGDGIAPRDLVGIAHVAFGAIGVSGAAIAMMALVDRAGLEALLLSGTLALVGGAGVLAGLWIRDGRWRGAVLAAVLDLAHLALMLLGSGRAGLLDVVLRVALLGGALWIMPELWGERATAAERATRPGRDRPRGAP